MKNFHLKYMGKFRKVTPFGTSRCHNMILLRHINVPNGVTFLIFPIYLQWEFSKCHNRFFWTCVHFFSEGDLGGVMTSFFKRRQLPCLHMVRGKNAHTSKICYDIWKTPIRIIWQKLYRLLHLVYLDVVTWSCYDI